MCIRAREYVSLPVSLFGKGEFYILKASGDSMEDAGIEDGDMVVIRKQPEAHVGDIVVALDETGSNTLKKYGCLLYTSGCRDGSPPDCLLRPLRRWPEPLPPQLPDLCR